MFGSQVLETAIGLIFVFLSVSLITSAIQELIASATKLRALTLRSGLKSMFVDGKQGLALSGLGNKGVDQVIGTIRQSLQTAQLL